MKAHIDSRFLIGAIQRSTREHSMNNEPLTRANASGFVEVRIRYDPADYVPERILNLSPAEEEPAHHQAGTIFFLILAGGLRSSS